MGDERHSERYLRGVIELLHGVELEQFDRDGRPRAVDYVFTSPDGTTGAVEMTTYRDGRAAALQSKLNRDGKTITCDSPRGWAVTVELGTKLDHLRRRLPPVIAACDRHGVDDPMRLPTSEFGADVQWFVLGELRLSPSPLSAPGTVEVRLPPRVSFPRNENLDHDLDRMLADEGIMSKLAKLRDHQGVSERHLAVGVHLYGSGFDLFDQLLTERGYVPRYALPDDFAATHVWITGGYRPVLTWTRPGGWVWRSLPTV
ncbi:hypothetical protein [Mycobacterium palustre]|uniref:Uncharacterized protein n=1 Tax=Mycobacterium palustre TaxID=153971 RepID=A0A1X1ZTH0_9MYCO|nr:hypothetical protein [Mycobacterium palustre]MCV7101153.1 hypothetical protein [Mycobacterium palustre]ORW26881.1 hypothetical protein AWC19_03235 [Mycobacterium palustre]